ncbi:toxin [uncultured Metabacillus sp.]|uniref:anthrax toxin lethal factor-related metalloendopeptidase n=1 Tax=uncultured Metabacillus sp. TaxID=2860135 RepID=UPI0026227A86|nr:toxin [uncultured Metabacillus sp.]
MKKGMIFLLVSLIWAPFYHLVLASPEGIPLSSYSFASAEEVLTKPILGEMVLLPETSFSEEDALIMIHNLQKIDENILILAANENIQIKLFNGSLTNQNGLSSLKDTKPRGYSDSDPSWNQVPGMSVDRVVYAKIGHSEYGKGHGSVSLELHEMAHAIDRYVFHYIRKDPKFLSIWKQEVGQLFPLQSYFRNFPEEYFAETFAMYYFSEDTRSILNKKAPMTSWFIQTLENQAEKRLR